jgi:hypothetical protein
MVEASVLSQQFAKHVGGLLAVIPASISIASSRVAASHRQKRAPFSASSSLTFLP